MHEEQAITLEGVGGTLAVELDPRSPLPRGRGPLMPSEIDVVLAKEGDREAFRRLYEEHRERIFRTACRYTASRQDAEDILQETFVKAFSRIRTFDFRISPNFASWLAAICVNTALDDLRRRGRRMGSQHISLADLPAEIPADGPSPEAGAARRLAVERIRATLGVLSPGQRAVFDLRFTEHLDIREIAAALGCGESSVKTQLGRALAKLRSTLEPERGKS